MFLRSMVVGLAITTVLTGLARADECVLSKDAQDGASIAKQCKSCHIFEADKPSKPTGPNLHDVYGRKPAARGDFAGYSEGMKGAAGKGVVWDDKNLMEYVGDPAVFLEKVNGTKLGHKMFFKLADEGKRKSVILFLKEIKDKPACN